MNPTGSSSPNHFKCTIVNTGYNDITLDIKIKNIVTGAVIASGIRTLDPMLGTTITETQLAWLARTPAVLLLMDADPAGRKAAKTIAQALDRHTTVLIHELPPEKEPEDLEDANLLSLVNNVIPFSLNPPSAVHAGTVML